MEISDKTRVALDRAKAASEAVNLAVLAGNAGRWIALRLSDGKSDGYTYSNKAEAVRFQLHENQCAYVKIPPDGMTPRQAKISVLDFQEALYDRGARLADPDQVIHQNINKR